MFSSHTIFRTYWPGPTWVNFVYATNAADHYACPKYKSYKYCSCSWLVGGVAHWLAEFVA